MKKVLTAKNSWRRAMAAAILSATAAALLPQQAQAAPAEKPTSVADQTDMLKVIRGRGYLVVGNSFKFPTFNDKNYETGQYEGFYVDLSKALAKEILGDENKLRFVYAGGVDNLGAVQFVVDGNVDVVIDSVAQSDAKRQAAFISETIFDSGSALLVRKGSSIKSYEDFKKGTTIFYMAFNNDREMLKAAKPDATYVPYLDSADLRADFAKGKGDAIAEFFPFLFFSASRIPNVQVVGQFTDKPYGMVSPKPDPAFAEYLSQFVRRIKANGEYEKIYQKWFGNYRGSADLNKPLHKEVMQKLVAAEAAARAKQGQSGAVSLSLMMVSAAAEKDKVRAQAVKESATLDAIRKRGKLVVGTAIKGRRTIFPASDAGVSEGFFVDVAHALANELPGGPSPVQWKFYSSELDALGAVRSGQVDVIVAGVNLGYNLENTEQAEFAVEIFRSGPALLVKKGAAISTIDDISPSTRVIYPKYLNREILRIKERAPKAKLIEVSSAADGFSALVAGKGDVYTDNLPELYNLAAQYGDYTLAGRYAERPYDIICRKGDEGMRAFLISFVAKLVASGEREKMNQKWFIPYGGAVVR